MHCQHIGLRVKRLAEAIAANELRGQVELANNWAY